MFDKIGVELKPFPMLSGAHVVPRYDDLRESWPADVMADCYLRDKAGIGFSPLARLRKEELVRHRKRLPVVWRDWLGGLESPRFKEEAKRFFAMPVAHMHARTYEFQVRAQLVECTARDYAHRVIGPHVDTPGTLWVIEVFFPHPDDADESGGFDFYRWKEYQAWDGDTWKANDEAVQMIRSVPYRPGAACGFVNSIGSLHSSGLRNPSRYPRRYVSISGHTKRERLFRK